MIEPLKEQALEQEQREQSAPQIDAHLIVFGNEKGGSGKSTSAMHAAIGLVRMGYRVGTIDLDARQGTLTHYMRNRFNFITKTRDSLPSPTHMAIERSEANSFHDRQREERMFLYMALSELGNNHDFIVIDTPGTDSHLSRLAHSFADTLVTPVNDSFIDVDVIADLDPDTYKMRGPSIYSKMVQDQAIEKEKRGGKPVNWIVMRNRLSHIAAKNKQNIESILEQAGKKLGFKIAPGFGERVIFREMFLKGLTLLDLQDDPDNKLTMSQVSARQEVRELINAIGPQRYKEIL